MMSILLLLTWYMCVCVCDVGVRTCVRAWRCDRELQEAGGPGGRGAVSGPHSRKCLCQAEPHKGQPPGAGREGAAWAPHFGAASWEGRLALVLKLVLKFTCLWAGPVPGDAAFPAGPRGPGWAGCGP